MRIRRHTLISAIVASVFVGFAGFVFVHGSMAANKYGPEHLGPEIDWKKEIGGRYFAVQQYPPGSRIGA